MHTNARSFVQGAALQTRHYFRIRRRLLFSRANKHKTIFRRANKHETIKNVENRRIYNANLCFIRRDIESLKLVIAQDSLHQNQPKLDRHYTFLNHS